MLNNFVKNLKSVIFAPLKTKQRFYGELAEWSIAAVLKTVDYTTIGVRIPHSPQTTLKINNLQCLPNNKNINVFIGCFCF